MSLAPKVFLSHHSSQHVVAKHLKDVLAKHGIEAWLASEDVPPGHPFDVAVTEAIEQTDAIVLLFCAEADKSRHVKREISMAESHSKLILPVRLEKIAPQGLAYWLQDYQWVEWFERRDEALERLVSAIRKVAGNGTSFVSLPDNTAPERSRSPLRPSHSTSINSEPKSSHKLTLAKPFWRPSKTGISLGLLGLGVTIGSIVAVSQIDWSDMAVIATVEVIEEIPAKEPGGRPQRLTIETLVEGTGPTPEVGQIVFVKYRGLLAEDETVFDEYRPVTLPVEGVFPEGAPFPVAEGQTIDGFFKGLQRVQKGGTYKLYIPSDMGYGDMPLPGSPIPPGADLIFEMEIIDIMSEEQFQVGMGILQQAIEANAPQGPQGAPPGL
ncbi:MAG: TIR domain-containing protein [Pseudomonadota bacterium]